MHPEMLSQIIQDRGRDARARAAEQRLARGLFKARRARKHGKTEQYSTDQYNVERDSFVVPAIPDYVDGSFREMSTAGAGDSSSAGPAAHRAA
jgi:hypothetical protein